MKKILVVMLCALFTVSCQMKKPAPIVEEPVPETPIVVTPEVVEEEDHIHVMSKTGKEVTLDDFELGQKIVSPLVLTGEIPTNWVFEGVFPVKLVDGSGATLASGNGTAEIFDAEGNPILPVVSFNINLNFATLYKGNGKIIISADNPSALPENDDSAEIDVVF